ncbi:unnamed protein product [Cylicostephanus goldi]|uniref:Uncharacterized protein n=1 Tax=Cylicostephanus goldi TaxID=71465 RepID=A0A3P7MRP3_CYLGO|nr:unnamed protein product [Cylicostephanus goldi]
MVQLPTGAKEQDLKSEQPDRKTQLPKNPQGFSKVREGDLRDGNTGSETRMTWPEGAYCIMPGRGTDCPAGFRMDSVSLAVPIDFGPNEEYSEGGRRVPYIRLGDTGGFKLTRQSFDQAYSLQLIACCKSS